jgi:hypothetical protein
MGRLTLPLFKKITTLAALLSLSLDTVAKTVEGVEIPESITCEGKEIPLQGHGIRKATIFGVKVFVLAFYAPSPIKNDDDPALQERPICFDITYLRAFDNKDVDKAWDYQFKESSMYKYPELKEHVSLLKKYFGEIKDERKQSFCLNKETTQVFENNKLQGEIKGEEFQKNFLSLWFGKNPPTKELKKSLLSGKK